MNFLQQYFTPVPSNGAENDFVGNIVEVQSLKLRIKRLIAEGEFANCFFIH